MNEQRYDVAIIGAGLAGLTLARQLELETELRVLVLDRRQVLPPREQKVGEATVQLSAYYYAKVLDLEEHLLHEHLMKYNLRFYWPTRGRANRDLEDLSQGYILKLSNIASYQLDRNVIEGELLRMAQACPRADVRFPVADVAVDLAPEGSEADHQLAFTAADGTRHHVTAGWVVDASGRARLLAKRRGMARRNEIRHGAFFFWVEGNLDIEKLTDLGVRERRLKRDRAELGHLPFALATNHFCGEGFWFWVIPLRENKTSLGLVFDRERVDAREVSSVPKLLAWLDQRYPLFTRDLAQRKVLYATGLMDFSHGCTQTLSADRWAFSGEAGRFLDPLYSPGGDLIAIHNTLIVDAIRAPDAAERAIRCRRNEQTMRAVYEAFVPSYALTYDLLGDAEAFSMKYVWELTIYFGFYVFPFINDLLTHPRGSTIYLRRFAQLGKLNRDLQTFLLDFYRYKKELVGALPELTEPRFLDFLAVGPLAEAEKTFYRVGVSVDEAREVLDAQLANVEQLARFFVAHVASRVVGDPRVTTSAAFVESIDLESLRFDAGELAARWARVADEAATFDWGFDPTVLERFRTRLAAPPVGMAVAEVAS